MTWTRGFRSFSQISPTWCSSTWLGLASAGLKEEIVSEPVIVKIGLIEVCPNPSLLSESLGDGRTRATSESTEAAEEVEGLQVSFGECLTSFQSVVFVKAFTEEKARIKELSNHFMLMWDPPSRLLFSCY
ncbi:uncharacterized protein [Montipora capricornis]|uniref:uncharacterized protein n=1 Tax=Montipora capricornis TaxID=246305 RepID=UPI0035F10DB1